MSFWLQSCHSNKPGSTPDHAMDRHLLQRFLGHPDVGQRLPRFISTSKRAYLPAELPDGWSRPVQLPFDQRFAARTGYRPLHQIGKMHCSEEHIGEYQSGGWSVVRRPSHTHGSRGCHSWKGWSAQRCCFYALVHGLRFPCKEQEYLFLCSGEQHPTVRSKIFEEVAEGFVKVHKY